MTPIDSPPPPSTRFAGLDGMRAIAVALVVAYHLFPAWWVQGGFIGVDVFFVISGFLITSLLIRPSARTGTGAGLAEFWRRRVRRLVPALVLVLTVCASAAWFVGGDVLTRLGAQILGALTFSYNWMSIAAGSGYFAPGTPELFRNLWSLAVEEQFYVLWPLLLPLVLLIRPAWGRALVALAAAGASAVWMAVIVASGGDVTRAYFGTDSHAFGLLIGVALAFVFARMPTRAWMSRRPVVAVVGATGVLAVTGILALSLVAPSDDTATFPGALLAASALAAVAILAGVWPGSWFGRTIDAAPLRWVGDRSYGIYLWHWPVLVLFVAWLEGTGPEAGVPVGIGAAALGVTLVASAVSYRFVEQPIRRNGFRAPLRTFARRLTGTPSTRFAALALVAAGVVAVGGTTAAIAAAPEETSAEIAILAGQNALKAQSAAPSASPPPSAEPSAVPPPLAAATPEPSAPSAPDPAVPSASPDAVTGGEITAVGDSVMLAAAPALLQKFPGIAVDAAVSRSMWAGPDVVGALAGSGQLRPYVVVALGTNGPVDADSLEEIARITGPERQLVLVNAYAPRDWIPEVNADLAAFAASHSGVVVADWSAAIGGRTDLLAGDRIHPGTAGGEVFAQTIDATVQQLEAKRTKREWARALVARFEAPLVTTPR